jgi:hypothetical protein
MPDLLRPQSVAYEGHTGCGGVYRQPERALPPTQRLFRNRNTCLTLQTMSKVGDLGQTEQRLDRQIALLRKLEKTCSDNCVIPNSILLIYLCYEASFPNIDSEHFSTYFVNAP